MTDPPIENGVVAIRDGRIESVSTSDSAEVDVDFGNAAILPGFVNAHTHLELGPLSGPALTDEIAWLKAVVAQRRNPEATSPRERARRNVEDLVASGTTLAADITTAGASWEAIAAAPLRATVFSELIGLKRERGIETCKAAFEWLAQVKPEMQVAANCRPGLSPHAPYSTSDWLYYRAVESKRPLTTHLAEMPEELELLSSRSGRLRAFLEELGAWDDEWSPLSPNPADYIRRRGLRDADWLVAHGTYFDEADFWRLRSSESRGDRRVAVVFCPRTHARFSHRPHPFREMLAKGVIVCLGTDSLASAPTLSVLDEVRFLARQDPSLSGRMLLTMATLFGAWALRAETIAGSVTPGKSADLAVVALPNRDEADPYRLVLDSDLGVIARVFEGALARSEERPI